MVSLPSYRNQSTEFFITDELTGFYTKRTLVINGLKSEHLSILVKHLFSSKKKNYLQKNLSNTNDLKSHFFFTIAIKQNITKLALNPQILLIKSRKFSIIATRYSKCEIRNTFWIN